MLNIVTNDSLEVLLHQEKRQSPEMEAASSSYEAADTVALIPCLTDPVERGMQVDEDLHNLENTQVTEPGRKRWKEDNVAKEMLTRCAEEAAGRASNKASMEMENKTQQTGVSDWLRETST